ncbi:MAG: tetratricopeptide repeat protein [Terriglobales bacterium]
MACFSRIFALILVLLPALGAVAQTRPTSLSAQTLLVLPFENESKAPGLEWISESFPELLGRRLASPQLYILSREDRSIAFDRAGIPANVHLSHATLYRIAEQMDADFVVLGSYSFDGQTFSARARLLDMKALRLSAEQSESGALVKLIDVQSALAWDLLRLIHPELLPSRDRFLASAPSIRLDALENYVRGVVATSRPDKIRRLHEAIRLSPDYTLAMLQLGRTYFDGRDYEQAATWFARVPRNDPGAREAGFYLGLATYYLGDFARSEEAFSFVASRLPLTEVYNNLGIVAGRRGKRTEIEYLQKAVKTDPNDPDYHFNLGIALYKAGDIAGASRQLRDTLGLHPGDSEAKALLDSIALAGITRGSDPSGVARVSDAGRAKVPLQRIKRNYDETSFQQLALEIQNATEQRLSRADPRTHAAFHVTRGREYLAQGFKAEAERDFREAVQLDPTSVEAHLGLAYCLEDISDASARAEAETALRLQPISTDALLVLARLDLKSNQRQAAEETVDRVLVLEPNNSAALALKRTIAEKELK